MARRSMWLVAMVGLVGCSVEVAPEPTADGTPEQGPRRAEEQVLAQDGTSDILVAGQDRPCGIAVDGSGLYWTNYGSGAAGGSIKRLDHFRATVSELAGGFGHPCAIALDDDSVYWSGYGTMSSGAVYRVAKDGGAVVAIAPGLGYPGSLAVRDGRAYWTNPVEGTIQSVSVEGGDVTTLASEQPFPMGIALGGDSVYWGVRDHLVEASLAGGAPSPILSQPGLSRGVASTASAVYRIGDDGALVAMPHDAAPQLLVRGAGGNGGSFAIAANESTVYFTDRDRGVVAGVPAQGGEVVELAVDQDEPAALALAGDTLYWVNEGDGTVRRILGADARVADGNPRKLAPRR